MEEYKNKVIQGDCLEIMPNFPDKSVDMILCDLPYGTTACKWDTIIPFEPLWEQYKRIIKDNGAIVLTASQPFTSALVMSNIKDFKYCWTWDKTTAKGHLVAKIRPMQQTEDILVFGKNKINYYPQMVDRPKNKIETTSERKRTEIMGGESKNYTKKYTQWYPKTLLTFKTERGLHPTQKPVALFEYLIKTYTNEGDLVLDNCAGSGTLGIAAINTKRNYILIEKDEHYCEVAKKRIDELPKQLF
jgi:site-specific DNA-methyltransferase (adenine-specific)